MEDYYGVMIKSKYFHGFVNHSGFGGGCGDCREVKNFEQGAGKKIPETAWAEGAAGGGEGGEAKKKQGRRRPCQLTRW